MADNANERTYLSRYVPSSETHYQSLRTSWRGIERRNIEDNGYLSSALNISTSMIPYIAPSPLPRTIRTGYTNPISIHGFDSFTLVIYRSGGAIKADYITYSGATFTGTLKASGATAADEYPRSVVQFNVYSSVDDPLGGTYEKKLLVFPDRMSMPFTVNSTFTFANINTTAYPIPAIEHAVVHLSRLFGVDDGRVYASGFNDYSMWDLDTADESLSSNAWCSTAQSNTRADSSFTGVTVYDNHVICFKKDYMQAIYNTKNPFRVVDITQIGAQNNECIAQAGGILFFASSSAIYSYTGAYPEDIGKPLNISNLSGAVAAAHGDTYYIYIPSDGMLYTYDITNGQWGARNVGSIISITSNDVGVYALRSSGDVVKIDGTSYGEWELYTDIIYNSSLDKRRLKKISLLAELDTGATLNVWSCDVDGVQHQIISNGSLSGRRTFRSAIRMTSAPCHRLKISGSGFVKLKYLDLISAYGGQVYVND